MCIVAELYTSEAAASNTQEDLRRYDAQLSASAALHSGIRGDKNIHQYHCDAISVSFNK